jgi:hypothetical protein
VDVVFGSAGQGVIGGDDVDHLYSRHDPAVVDAQPAADTECERRVGPRLGVERDAPDAGADRRPNRPLREIGCTPTPLGFSEGGNSTLEL